MLREHRVDIECPSDVVGRIDCSNLDMRLVARGEYASQVVGADRKNLGPGDRIAGDAAAEIAHAPSGIAAALAEKVDERDELAGLAGLERADIGDEPAIAHHRLDLASNLSRRGDGRVLVRLKRGHRGTVEPNLRS